MGSAQHLPARMVSSRAKPNRIRKREEEGAKPATLKSRSEWPKGRKLQSRPFAQRRPA